MRLDYDAKKGGAKKSFISTAQPCGREPANLQVFKSSANGNVVPARPLAFLLRIRPLTRIRGELARPTSTYGATVLELTRNSSAQYKRVYFVVATDGHVEKSIVIDANDNTNEFSFKAHDLTTKLDGKLFQFDPSRCRRSR